MTTHETTLSLSLGGFPPWSARGCSQSLTPIANGELRRTVNGELLYTGTPLHAKYRSRIHRSDKATIAFADFWIGAQVKVGCVQRLWQKFTGSQVELARDPVLGSVCVVQQEAHSIETKRLKGRLLTLQESLQLAYVSYRPFLLMRVCDFAFETDEWDMKVGWRLDLEEC